MSIDDESHELKCLEICPSIKHHHFTDIIYILYYIMSMSEIAVYLPSYHCKKKTILISALKQKNAPKQTLYINVGVTRQNISLM